MFEGLVPLLALATLLIVAVLALVSKERTKDRMRDPNAPISTLAKDGKYGGVAFLVPLDRQEPVRSALPDEYVRRRSTPEEGDIGYRDTGVHQPAFAHASAVDPTLPDPRLTDPALDDVEMQRRVTLNLK